MYKSENVELILKSEETLIYNLSKTKNRQIDLF